MMDEMPVHPLAVHARARNHGVDRLVDLPSEGERGTHRRPFPRRIDDGQRQQPQNDADGGQQRDQVASRDRLATVGMANRLLPA